MLQFFLRIVWVIMGLALLMACQFKPASKENATFSHRREKMEAEAQKRLQTAREQLAQNQCKAAKTTIEQMRTDCYLALNARRQGILLMDSVDLQQARNDVAHADSMMQHDNSSAQATNDFAEACRKVQFYERKIQYDKSHTKSVADN